MQLQEQQQEPTYEISGTTTSPAPPEDIFGNTNLKKLREEGVLEYITEGFLPSAKLVFIDEIFKSNKVLAESLFRAINEKKFRNGSKEISLPWLAFFSASNEVRVNTQADRAFLDRFKIFATVLSPTWKTYKTSAQLQKGIIKFLRQLSLLQSQL